MAYVLLHSPLVGPSTWYPVADRLRAAGATAVVPVLTPALAGDPPYWPRMVRVVRTALAGVPRDEPVAVVAHSNAGLYVPVVCAELDHPVAASVFVDAAMPARSGDTPVEPPHMLHMVRGMAVDGVVPRWTDWWDAADVATLFPDDITRQRVTAEQPCLPLAYFESSVPVPDGWADHPVAYLQLSPGYEAEAAEAADRAWRVESLPGDHLHQLVDPDAVTARLRHLTR